MQVFEHVSGLFKARIAELLDFNVFDADEYDHYGAYGPDPRYTTL